MSKKEVTVPHIVSHDQGAHDLKKKTSGTSSTKGNHSGRPHPPKQSAGGDDFAAGAFNGGGVGAGATIEVQPSAVVPAPAGGTLKQ